MTEEQKQRSDLVKRETMLITGFVCVAVGFILGVAFSAYKGASRVPIQAQAPQSMAPQQPITQDQGPTPQQARIIQNLELRTSMDPQDIEAWTVLGNTYFDAGQYDEAIGAYNKSLSLAPDDPNVWTDLGIMYRRTGQPQKAIEAFDKAISIDPAHENSWFNKGIVLMHDLNDRAGAIDAWEELIEINPNALTPNGSQSLKGMIDRFRGSTDPSEQ